MRIPGRRIPRTSTLGAPRPLTGADCRPAFMPKVPACRPCVAGVAGEEQSTTGSHRQPTLPDEIRRELDTG
jgi:hypothetical protein